MTEWVPIELGSLIDIKHGYAFPGTGITTEETDDILVTPGNFEIGGGFKADKFKYFHGDFPSEYILKEGDLIVTMTDLSRDGDTLGYSAKVPQLEGKRFLHNQRIGLISIKDAEVSGDFVYWLMRTRRYRFYVLGSATGSTVRHTSPDRIKQVEIDIPRDPSVQAGIAETLSSLDDKIELNRKQNRTLEAIAQALFKRWFVEFEFPDENGRPYQSSGGAMQPSELGEIPVGWEVKSLSDVTTYLSRGLTPAYIKDGGVVVLNQRCVRDGWINLEPARRHDTEARKIDGRELMPGDVLVNSTGVGTLGRVAQLVSLDETMVVDSHVTVVRANPDLLSSEYLGVCLRLKEREIEYMAEGSTGQTELSRAKLAELPIIVPGERILGVFSEIAQDFNSKRALNWKESISLVNLRDTLLPKLMSGELRVA